MSNLPDDFNQALFDSTIGSSETAAEASIRTHRQQLISVVKREFDKSPRSAAARWIEIEKSLNLLDNAMYALRASAWEGSKMKKNLDSEREYAREANNDHEYEATVQAVGCYAFVYESHIEEERL